MSSTLQDVTIGADTMVHWLALFIEPDQVTELRALRVIQRYGRPITVAGFFDGRHRDEMAQEARRLTQDAAGVYFTINPLKSEILARCANRTKNAENGSQASDEDVLHRRFLPVDVDPVRMSGISASAAEKEEAHQVAQAVFQGLRERGWPDAVVCDSGNGFHLLYRIDLPVDDGGKVERILAALAARYDTAGAKIDKTVSNPARILKVPGTWARKGDNTEDRPHRCGSVKFEPQPLQPVPLDLLDAMAAEAPAPAPAPAPGPAPAPAPPPNGHPNGHDWNHRLDVPRWLMDNGVSYTTKAETSRTVFILDKCPFDGTHVAKDAAIFQNADGRLGFHCFHDSCSGYRWQDAKKKIGVPTPLHYDPPLKTRQSTRRQSATASTPEVAPDRDVDNATDPRIMNYRLEQIEKGDRVEEIAVGLAQENIHEQLKSIAGDWPISTGGFLVVEGPDYVPRALEDANPLFAWVGGLLPGERDNHILWRGGGSTVSQARFYEHLLQSCRQFDSVEQAPHFPAMPGCYYMHPPLPPSTGEHLQTFLDFFTPMTPEDRSLLLAFVLSLFWGGPCGKRPAWLIAGPDVDEHGGRGVGKTTCALKCTHLVGGHVMISNTAEAKSEDIERRLLSPNGRKIRNVLIDNLKALKFSWAYLEAIITEEIFSGRQMYVGEGSRPNNLTVIITANGATLSRDMAQRGNVLRLARPAYRAGDWDEEVDAYIAKHRWDIIADVQAIFAVPPAKISKANRWGPWQKEVLARVPDPEKLQKLLDERSEDIDEDQEEMMAMQEAIANAIRTQGYDPATHRIKIKASHLAKIANEALNEKMRPNKATAYVRQLQIPEMRGRTRDGGRYYYWHGKDAEADAQAMALEDPVPAPPRY
jgi:hypothetical protein